MQYRENKLLLEDNELLKNLKPRDIWLIKEKIKLMRPQEFEEFCEKQNIKPLFSGVSSFPVVTEFKQVEKIPTNTYDKVGGSR